MDIHRGCGLFHAGYMVASSSAIRQRQWEYLEDHIVSPMRFAGAVTMVAVAAANAPEDSFVSELRPAFVVDSKDAL